jgi:uncharacterized protein (TIGR03086 family)
MTIMDLRPLHRRSLELTGGLIAKVRPEDLGRPTPCEGWDLGMLVAHMIGQNQGFAEALDAGDAPLSAFEPRPVGGGLFRAWRASVDRLVAAVAAVSDDRQVRLIEISDEMRFPASVAIGFQLLDTVIHGWDVASGLGQDFRPDGELVTVTLQLARRVPGGEARGRPGAAFAPERAPASDDDWVTALALLGRRRIRP